VPRGRLLAWRFSKKRDVEAFTNAVFEYDQICKLDKFKTSLLLRIKTNLKDAAESVC